MTNLEIVHTDSALAFENGSLREHASSCNVGARTTTYRVLRDGAEVAFLALDRVESVGQSQKLLIIYDMWVVPKFRTQGVGNSILELVEELGAHEECDRIRLTPHPTPSSGGLSTGQLSEWYRRHGYTSAENIPNELEKLL